jgi:hypothetical protein
VKVLVSGVSSPELDVLPINSMPFGLTYGDWTAKWWKWLLSIPKSRSPAMDTSGRHILSDQPDSNVLFLCQTIESAEHIPVRKGVIPHFRAILLPIINWISALGIDGKNEKELTQVAKRKMDVVNHLEICMNGIKLSTGLQAHRVQSPFFSAYLPMNNILDYPEGNRKFISDGYWIFFRVTSERIKLLSVGSCSSGATRIAVEYELKFV